MVTIFIFIISTLFWGCGSTDKEITAPQNLDNSLKTASSDYSGSNVEGVAKANTQKNSLIKNSEKCFFDFLNFTFPRYKAQESFKLVDGKKEPTRFENGMVKNQGYNLISQTFSDLNNDGIKEAIVTISMTTGGSSSPFISYVFKVSKTPELVDFFHFGDRADGGLRDIYFDNGYLAIEVYEPEKSRGDCCPLTYRKTKYSIEKNRLVEIEKSTGLVNDTESAAYLGSKRSCIKEN